jgi:hypothetical protein
MGMHGQGTGGGGVFSVCRGGYGWESTLAHRQLVDPCAPISEFELTLARFDTGVYPRPNPEVVNVE